MGAKQELLEKAEQEYDGLKAAIKGLDEAQMSQVWLGSWGVREILAHVTGWHREMIPALERLGRGEAPYPDGAYDDFDSWNARFVEARKGQAVGGLLREVDASHRELLERRLPAARRPLRRGQVGFGAGGWRHGGSLPRARRTDPPVAPGLRIRSA